MKVEFIDFAFTIDPIVVAVTLTLNLSKTKLGSIGALDIGQFILVLIGGMIAVIIIHFTASTFEKMIKRKPKLESVIPLVTFWVGIKLAVYV
ncbi:hypothetical protein CN488_30595, partial [Bacillus anthracis]